ncbi:MAG: GGDEF domain-containing protein [Thermodesulfovibrionales bacterium]|nr:GGDEF domain-containing protein [Thermodesulfovibrionales bacterium]
MLLVIVGLIDYITGNEISLSLFYLLPVSLATWYAGKWNGILFCFAGATIWFFADMMAGHVYSRAGIPYWNASVRLGFFLVVSYLLTRLRTSLAHEKTLSRTDSLTGLYNTRAFYDFAKTEIQRSRRFKRPLTLGYMDLDNFKTVNDQLGHSTGDVLLQSVAEIIRNNTRAVDISARLGGDEFAILLTETGIESARTVFLKIQEKILEVMQRNSWPVTVSIGSVTYKSPPETVDDMVRKADNLMYTVKNSGKNSIMHELAEK